MTQQLLLRLYVAGASRSAATVQAVRMFVEDFDAAADLVVIDILLDPEAAERDGILATPMLIRAEPTPERRVIGGFSNARDVREALNL